MGDDDAGTVRLRTALYAIAQRGVNPSLRDRQNRIEIPRIQGYGNNLNLE